MIFSQLSSHFIFGAKTTQTTTTLTTSLSSLEISRALVSSWLSKARGVEREGPHHDTANSGLTPRFLSGTLSSTQKSVLSYERI
ncbi:hypothetical protein PROFUN_12614 [Planoprotostelium fungivorum]|uniref:Uncharacterized protein n=1 Tax=Planoprotostelium fungivorum TaxID=1890364 RepID=A0A2P6N718_9EUKA|nr:hypothetical protein PROFUN_12614 [Planoprotostelium fungivorum]